MRPDRELEEYRSLIEPPARFMDGFSLKSVVGCLFIGMVMMPASMYLGLLAGAGLSGAAQWVTVILFVELARRSFTTLKQPEIFILFYMAGAAIASPFSGLLWTQYFVQSDPAIRAGIADQIPWWVAPTSPDILAHRSFFQGPWLAPILVIVAGNLLARIDSFDLGYVLYRWTSDAEKLPFPMAPVGALGVTALAESSAGESTWRLGASFSIGGMIGLVFGAIFIAIPSRQRQHCSNNPSKSSPSPSSISPPTPKASSPASPWPCHWIWAIFFWAWFSHSGPWSGPSWA